jgi:hypothetical protein
MEWRLFQQPPACTRARASARQVKQPGCRMPTAYKTKEFQNGLLAGGL